MSLELYHHGSSVCAAKVRLALAEKGVEWEGHYLDILAGDQFSKEYLKLNPKAVVPTLIHDGKVIRESSVICEYIDDVFPGPALKPKDPVAIAEMRLWTKRVDEDIHPSVRPVTYVSTHRHTILKRPKDEVEDHINSDPDPVWRERKRGWFRDGVDASDVRQAIHVLDHLLEDMEATLVDRDWLVGDGLTLADGAVTPYVNRLALLGFSEMWDERPRVTAWFDRVKARSSFEPAIFQYLPETLRSEMSENGQKAWPAFKTILSGGYVIAPSAEL